MKISVITPDFSHNCLGRAYLLAKILQRQYEVEIAGFVFGEKKWSPLADDRSVDYKAVKVGRLSFCENVRDLVRKIDGDVLYASKPLVASFGVGLLKKWREGNPLVLDIDDWERGFMKAYCQELSPYYRLRYLGSSLFFYEGSSYWNSLLCERLVSCADEITVSNRFLRTKFGGAIVWHGRDTTVFDPQKFDRDTVRERYKIRPGKVIMFFGTPLPYKGLEDLIEAVKLLKEGILVIVGLDESPYCRSIISAAEPLGERFKGMGLQPFEKVPEFLAAADVVVIPQKKSPATIGQLPAKVFDAMAMAKPLVVTRVSDLPEIVEGCGWVVEPGNVEELAGAIQYILDHPEEAQEVGFRARERCKEKYSWDAIEDTLIDVFEKYE